MSYTQNQKIRETTTLNTISPSKYWANVNWFKVGKYVDKLRATSQGQKFVMHLNDACQCNSIKGIDNVVVQVILPRNCVTGNCEVGCMRGKA